MLTVNNYLSELESIEKIDMDTIRFWTDKNHGFYIDYNFNTGKFFNMDEQEIFIDLPITERTEIYADNSNLQYQIETLIDKIGTKTLLTYIEQICYEKAEHIRSNWQQNNSLSKEWDRAGWAIDTANSKIDGI